MWSRWTKTIHVSFTWVNRPLCTRLSTSHLFSALLKNQRITSTIKDYPIINTFDWPVKVIASHSYCFKWSPLHVYLSRVCRLLSTLSVQNDLQYFKFSFLDDNQGSWNGPVSIQLTSSSPFSGSPSHFPIFRHFTFFIRRSQTISVGFPGYYRSSEFLFVVVNLPRPRSWPSRLYFTFLSLLRHARSRDFRSFVLDLCQRSRSHDLLRVCHQCPCTWLNFDRRSASCNSFDSLDLQRPGSVLPHWFDDCGALSLLRTCILTGCDGHGCGNEGTSGFGTHHERKNQCNKWGKNVDMI
jgi:hypothetical protein